MEKIGILHLNNSADGHQTIVRALDLYLNNETYLIQARTLEEMEAYLKLKKGIIMTIIAPNSGIPEIEQISHLARAIVMSRNANIQTILSYSLPFAPSIETKHGQKPVTFFNPNTFLNPLTLAVEKELMKELVKKVQKQTGFVRL